MNGSAESCDLQTKINGRQQEARQITTMTHARIRGNGGNTMRPIGVFGTTTMFLLLGLSFPASAWQDPQEKPQKQEQPAKPEKQQQAQADKQQQQHAQQQAKGQQEQQQKQQHQQQHSAS